MIFEGYSILIIAKDMEFARKNKRFAKYWKNKHRKYFSLPEKINKK